MADIEHQIEMVNKLLQEISETTFEIGSWTWVDVLHINNPHNFYVRPRTYSKYLPMLQARGRTPIPAEVNVGDVYVFKSKLLKCNVRGKVITAAKTADDVNCRMFAIDIGCCEDDVPLRSLAYTMYPSQVPSLVTLCQLADCTPRGGSWDEQAVDAMRNYVEGERAKMIIRNRTSDKLIVELYNSCPDDIATLLALTDYTTFGYVETTINGSEAPRVPDKVYARRKLEENMIIHVHMQSGNFIDQFFVTPIEEYSTYLNDRNNFSAQVGSQPELTMEELKVNAPVGVFHCKNNTFERGIVKVLMADFERAVVQLVDLGTVVEDAVFKMKDVPDWCLRIPPRAICCLLHHSQPYNQELAKMAHPGTEFMIVIKKAAYDNFTPSEVVVSALKNK